VKLTVLSLIINLAASEIYDDQHIFGLVEEELDTFLTIEQFKFKESLKSGEFN